MIAVNETGNSKPECYWTAIGAGVGAGIGMAIGLAGWGADAIAYGSGLGAGIGVALGTSRDALNRRRHHDDASTEDTAQIPAAHVPAPDHGNGVTVACPPASTDTVASRVAATCSESDGRRELSFSPLGSPLRARRHQARAHAVGARDRPRAPLRAPYWLGRARVRVRSGAARAAPCGRAEAS